MINTLQTLITLIFQGEHGNFLEIFWDIKSNHVIPITYEHIFDCKAFAKGKKIQAIYFDMSSKSNRMSSKYRRDLSLAAIAAYLNHKLTWFYLDLALKLMQSFFYCFNEKTHIYTSKWILWLSSESRNCRALRTEQDCHWKYRKVTGHNCWTVQQGCSPEAIPKGFAAFHTH